MEKKKKFNKSLSKLRKTFSENFQAIKIAIVKLNILKSFKF